MAWDGDIMAYIYTNGAWAAANPPIYRKSYNLFDKTNTSTTDGYTADNYLKDDGTYGSNASYDTSVFIALEPSTTYTLSFSDSMTVYAPSLCLYASNKTYVRGIKYDGQHSITFTTSATETYVRLSIQKTYVDSYMLNEGSTALPYEPYDTTLKWYAAADHKRTSGAWS